MGLNYKKKFTFVNLNSGKLHFWAVLNSNKGSREPLETPEKSGVFFFN